VKRFLASAAVIAIATIAVPFARVGAASAAKGNGADAKLCQKNGWQSLVNQDGSVFRNQGDCFSHAAQREPVSAPSPAQQQCQDLGGTFTSSGTNHWTCTGWPVTSVQDGQTKGDTLAALCGGISSVGPGPDSHFWDAACSPFAA
jgi:hypothetical protein